MSLDVTFEALTQFGRQLEIFDAALRASYHELRECHDAVDGLWRDEARRAYDRRASATRGPAHAEKYTVHAPEG